MADNHFTAQNQVEQVAISFIFTGVEIHGRLLIASS